MNIHTDINIIGSIPDWYLIYMVLPLWLTNQVELENILETKRNYLSNEVLNKI